MPINTRMINITFCKLATLDWHHKSVQAVWARMPSTLVTQSPSYETINVGTTDCIILAQLSSLPHLFEREVGTSWGVINSPSKIVVMQANCSTKKAIYRGKERTAFIPKSRKSTYSSTSRWKETPCLSTFLKRSGLKGGRKGTQKMSRTKSPLQTKTFNLETWDSLGTRRGQDALPIWSWGDMIATYAT